MRTLSGCAMSGILALGLLGSADAVKSTSTSSSSLKAGTTTNKLNERLGIEISKMGKKVQGVPGRWTFEFQGNEMVVLTDVKADRMRIMSPIAKSKALQRNELEILLSANYDRALDAKYAINEGIVWATFTHPFAALTKLEFISAVEQVAALRQNYGTTFSSTDVVFGG